VDIGETLYLTDIREWRRWLKRNHASKPEIWLVYYGKASGKPSIAYNDVVDEALCFGWIDSTVKKHGPQSRAQRFTPRRPGSKLSEMNKVRVRRLVEAKRMTKDGLDAAGDVLDEPFVIPADILEALESDEQTWRNFEAFPNSYKRIRVGFVEGARGRPQVFRQRLAYFLKMTAANKRFGMVL